MLGISVNIQGDKEFMNKIEKLGGAIEDFKEALGKIGEAMVHYYSNDVFASQGGQFGPSWQQLAPATQATKIKHYTAYAAVPLIRTGTMKDSFESKASSKSLTVTNSAPYFPYHQSSAPRTKLPRRQMMGIDKKMKDMIKEVIQTDIDLKVAFL